MAGRRRRSLSLEERLLWQQVTAAARPLRPGAAPVPEPDARDVAPVPPLPPRAAPPSARSEPRVSVDLAPDLHATAAHPAMDHRRYHRLLRGRYEPEARLDLHGMTTEAAHAALTDFILGAHGEGLRLVLIITGKGRPDHDGLGPRRYGILRHNLPHWLAAPPLSGRILEVAPAHQRHGGGGATYVYLRRARP